MEARTQVSDRLRFRGKDGRASSPARRDKDFFKVGPGDRPFESADGDMDRSVVLCCLGHSE